VFAEPSRSEVIFDTEFLSFFKQKMKDISSFYVGFIMFIIIVIIIKDFYLVW